MGFTATLNEIPRPVWIAAMVLGFIWWWPVGLAVLAGLIGSRHWACADGPRRWRMHGNGQQAGGGWSPWRGCCGGSDRRASPPSGNAAFDDYRAETLHRLEDEQREFQAYLERLRRARDKAEFDQFMAERRAGKMDTSSQA